MDDLKLFSKSEKQMDTPMRIVYVFSTDWDGVWNKKCGIFTTKRGKVVRCVGIKLPTREVMKEVKKRRYSYLGIFELDKIKDNKKKKKNNKEIKAKALIGPKLKTRWEKQNNSNKYMDNGCVQIQSRNATVEIE